jgi:hypothetical protein
MILPTCLLAYAESPNNPNALLLLILESIGLIAAVVIAALLPLMVSRSRKHRGVDIILGGCVFWGLVAAGDGLYFLLARYHSAREYETLVNSGYFDPANTTGAPAPEWIVWSLLAGAYVGLLIYAGMGRTASAAPSTPGGTSTNGHPKRTD